MDTSIIGFVPIESDHLYATSEELIDGLLHVLD
jgi:hypothetical protein